MSSIGYSPLAGSPHYLSGNQAPSHSIHQAEKTRCGESTWAKQHRDKSFTAIESRDVESVEEHRDVKHGEGQIGSCMRRPGRLITLLVIKHMHFLSPRQKDKVRGGNISQTLQKESSQYYHTEAIQSSMGLSMGNKMSSTK